MLIELSQFHRLPVALIGKCVSCSYIGAMDAASADGSKMICRGCAGKVAVQQVDELTEDLRMIEKPSTWDTPAGMYLEEIPCNCCSHLATKRVGGIPVCNDHLGALRMAIQQDGRGFMLHPYSP